MSDVAETKPDPTTAAPEEQKPETTTTGEGEKSVTEAATDVAKDAAEATKDAAVKTSDTVFSMFGGGPKKEKKEDAEEGEDEPSGSSKAQKAGEEVSLPTCFYFGGHHPENFQRYHLFHAAKVQTNKATGRGTRG